jgi:hypothetical protein
MRLHVPVLVLAVVAAMSRPALAADFNVTVMFPSYIVNGAPNPSIRVVRGQTYTFDISTFGHPFFIKTAQVTGSGSAYNDGVTNNGTQGGTITFQVPATAPDTLFYICSIHSVMTGIIHVTAPPVPAASPLGLVLLALAIVVVGGGLIVRSRPGRARASR